MAHIEDFFSTYHNSACDGGALNGDVLTELFQGVLTGHAVELIQMNDGAYYVFVIYAHDVHAWNCSEEGNFHTVIGSAPRAGRGYYRFEQLEHANEAVASFLLASFRDQCEAGYEAI